MKKSSLNNIMTIAMIGVLGALVFAASHISFNLVTVAGNTTRLHLGNVMCLLSGLILGPVPGGIAAGLGSMFFDFTNPLYITSAPFTLVFKFLMAFICGKIAWAGEAQAKVWGRNILAAVAGQMSYIVLYLGKNFIVDVFFSRLEVQTALIAMAQKGGASVINGVIAVIAAVPLAAALRKGLEQAHFRGLPGTR